MKKWAVISFLFCLMTAACQDPYKEPEKPVEETCILQVQTEAFSSEEAAVELYWTAFDTLAVYTEAHKSVSVFHLQSGLAKTSARFTGETAGKPYIVLSPYSARASETLGGKDLPLNFPGTQIYLAGGVSTGSCPMLAVGESTELNMKNLCGVVQILLTGEANVNGIRLSSKNKQPLNGRASVRTDEAESPRLTLSGGSSSIVLQCPGVALSEDTPTAFLLALPPAVYSGGFEIEVETYTGTETFQWEQDVTLGRSRLVSSPVFTCQGAGGGDPDNIPSNQIWYTTRSGQKLSVKESAFRQKLVSHTYGPDDWGKLVFDGPITAVGKEAFSYTDLTDLRLPDCVTSIGSNALFMSGITAFRTPASLKQVGAHAFAYCYSLTRFYGDWASADESSIILPDGELAAYATGRIDGALEIPEGATSLADSLFYRDLKIREVVLPEGLQSMGVLCFWHQPLLERMVLPSTLKSVGRHAFAYCDKLRAFEGPCPMIRDGRFLVDDGGWLVGVAGCDVTELDLPADVSMLGSGAIVGLNELQSIRFGRTLENLYNDAISDCGKLEFFYGPGTTDDHHGLLFYGDYLVKTTPILPEEYTVPQAVTRIFWSAFEDNKTTRRLVVTDQVESIGNYCFKGMSQLSELCLSASLKEIGVDAFRYCNKLEHLYLRSVSPPLYPNNSYFGHNGLTIHVPMGSETYYKAADGWKEHARFISGYAYTDLPDAGIYHSSDFSDDGKVTRLQKATEGEGVNIVLMGDAFSDRQMANGIYDSVMAQMADALMSVEPFASYRNLVNIYAVKVVSGTEGYGDSGQALGTWFGTGTEVGGDDNACIRYALKALPEAAMDNAVIVVAMNSTTYAGSCKMFTSTSGDGAGTGIAYVPLCPDDLMFTQVLCHEALGHGFAKLADEYADISSEIPAAERKACSDLVVKGWFKNIDFTPDRSTVKWARFLQDERYAQEKLGCYEGAYNYAKGVWRPTEESLMRYNYGDFNAPSREAIWYRLHRLAYGSSWEYSYDAFAEYDAVNRGTKAPDALSAEALPSLPPPVIVPQTWREAYAGH